MELNWEKIREDFEKTSATMQELAEIYGVSAGTIRSRKSREGWEKTPDATQHCNATHATQRGKGKSTRKKSKKKNKGSYNSNGRSGAPAKQPQEDPGAGLCFAHKKHGGGLCHNPAGFKTPHPGIGRCYLHGGCSPGAPLGNKHALKTGEYEAIWLDALDEEEQALFGSINVDKEKQLEQEIRLLEIRERRMLHRIAEILATADEDGLTTVEATEETGGEDGGKDTKKRRGALGQVQDIEEALTRVQEKKGRLLELKHKFELNRGPGTPDLSVYLEALKAIGQTVWGEELEE